MTVQEAVTEFGRMLAQLVLTVQQLDLMYPSPKSIFDLLTVDKYTVQDVVEEL